MKPLYEIENDIVKEYKIKLESLDIKDKKELTKEQNKLLNVYAKKINKARKNYPMKEYIQFLINNPPKETIKK